MDRRITFFSGLILLIFVLFLTGCKDGLITGATTKETSAKIGVLLPLTGDASAYGENAKKGVELALEGTNLEVVYEDGRCDGQQSVNAIKKLIEVDNVVAVIGEMCSGATLPASAVAKEAGVVLISPASTSPDLSKEGNHFFRTVPSDAFQGVEAANLVKRLGYQNLAVLYVNDDYGVGFDRVLKENFNNVVASETFEKQATDLRTQLTKIKDSGADAIYIVSNSPSAAGAALKQINELGIEAQIFGSEGLKDESVLEAAEGAAESLILTFLRAPQTLIGKQFVNRYKERYDGEPGIFVGESYDAVLALNEAILNSDGTREGIKNALREVEFEGASGLIKFDSNGDVQKSYTVLRVESGKSVDFE